MAKASIIMPLYNKVYFTKMCIQYLVRNTPWDLFHCYLIDNGSTDDTREYCQTLPDTHFTYIHNPVNSGFATACNIGAQQANTPYLVFLNNDTVPHEGWLQGLVELMEGDSQTGAVGCKLLFPDNKIQHAGVVFGFAKGPYHIYEYCRGDAPYVNQVKEYRAVTGACIIVNKGNFNQVQGFDENYINCLEDIDLCFKLRKLGKKIIYYPGSVLTHFQSQSQGRNDNDDESLEVFRAKWKNEIIQDDLDHLVADNMRLHYKENKFVEFIPLCEQVTRLALQKQQASLQMKMKNIKGAFKIYQELFRHYPYDDEILNAIGNISTMAGLPEDADFYHGMALKLQK